MHGTYSCNAVEKSILPELVSNVSHECVRSRGFHGESGAWADGGGLVPAVRCEARRLIGGSCASAVVAVV
ncbi:hypothetical protein BC831DRAFT_449249 [Entophlyctis helioformis]|nr:hypothetical protein BC831DRAFT_449249 [Entophlyctis helioformis]